MNNNIDLINHDLFEGNHVQSNGVKFSSPIEQQKEEFILNTFEQLSRSFQDPWISPHGKEFKASLEKLSSEEALKEIYSKHPELSTFPASKLTEGLQSYALSRYQKKRVISLNNVASYLFNEFDKLCKRIRETNAYFDEYYPENLEEFDSHYTDGQIKDYKKLIVTCFEDFQEKYPEALFTEEKILQIELEIRKNTIKMLQPELTKTLVEGVILTVMR